MVADAILASAGAPAPVLLLREPQAGRVLLVSVPWQMADRLADELRAAHHHITHDRPDVAGLRCAVVDSPEDGPNSACLVYGLADGRSATVHATPSEAVLEAVLTGVPVYAPEALLSDAFRRPETLGA